MLFVAFWKYSYRNRFPTSRNWSHTKRQNWSWENYPIYSVFERPLLKSVYKLFVHMLKTFAHEKSCIQRFVKPQLCSQLQRPRQPDSQSDFVRYDKNIRRILAIINPGIGTFMITIDKPVEGGKVFGSYFARVCGMSEINYSIAVEQLKR